MKKRKKIFMLFILFYPILGYGQDTIYYNTDMEVVALRDSAEFYKLLEKDKIDSTKVIERCYYMSGQLESEALYIEKGRINGVQKSWYKNGQLKSAVDYSYGSLNGTVLTYWENGQLKRKDSFRYDQLISGECYNSDGIRIDHFDYNIFAEFPGGQDKLMKYVNDNLKDPINSQVSDAHGQKVFFKFKIGKDGTISDIKITDSATPELDMVALRIIKNMPKWRPALQDGEPVICVLSLPIFF